jgi:hypothetical protein
MEAPRAPPPEDIMERRPGSIEPEPRSFAEVDFRELFADVL